MSLLLAAKMAMFIPRVASAVRSHGGLVIADERLTGLGRTGNHMWGFQGFGVG